MHKISISLRLILIKLQKYLLEWNNRIVYICKDHSDLKYQYHKLLSFTDHFIKYKFKHPKQI